MEANGNISVLKRDSETLTPHRTSRSTQSRNVFLNLNIPRWLTLIRAAASTPPFDASFFRSIRMRRMYVVSGNGASGSGKTACLAILRQRNPQVVWYDFDEVGVPADVDQRWRHRTTEYWLRRASENQAKGLRHLHQWKTSF